MIRFDVYWYVFSETYVASDVSAMERMIISLFVIWLFALFVFVWS